MGSKRTVAGWETALRRGERAAMTRTRVVGAVLIAVVSVALATTPSASMEPAEARARHRDNDPGPLAAGQQERRAAAHQLMRAGEIEPNDDGVVQLAEDKWVEAEVTGTAKLFVLLVEFGDGSSRRFGTDPGPRHNEIEEPDRSVDNSTIWAEDFDVEYFEDLYFGASDSLASFYTEQSSGRYTVEGTVHDWVQLADNESSYGDNAIEDAGGLWRFTGDSVNAWYQAQIAAGRTKADITSEVASFDVWDRYDFDRDGNFDEADGYIDHPQLVHAGEGEETGGGEQGGDAIWSRFSYANPYDFGITGPTVDGTPVLFGGVEVGDTGIWVSENVIVPESAGLGVVAHEYGHDLFLPDLYNYEGAGYNGIGHWSLMSLGSYLSHEGGVVGTAAGALGPWEKMELGWLDYDVVAAGASASHTLRPAASTEGDAPQALVVDVPDEGLPMAETRPTSGVAAWWTGRGDLFTSTLTRSLDLTGLARPILTAKLWYDIETGYDYLYPEYSLDDGLTWASAAPAISGSSHGRWATVRYSLPAESMLFRFRYETDFTLHYAGAFIDDISVSSGRVTVFHDDVESGDNGWTPIGFTRSDGEEERVGDRYYLLENRTYAGSDITLESGPFNYGRFQSLPYWADHFTYPDGLLVWVVDETYDANETFVHPGHGLALPVDARPAPFVRPSGRPSPNHLQVFDAAFGLHTVDEIAFRSETTTGHGPNQTIVIDDVVVPASAAIATFDDSVPERYWSADNPTSSTLVAGHGVTATVTEQIEGGAITVFVTTP